MDEGRRFLRYVTPVALMAVEIGFFVYLLSPWALDPFKDFLIQQVEGAKGAGLIIGAVLGSGAVGMMLSAVHHSIAWIVPQWGIDYRNDVSRLYDEFAQEIDFVGGWPGTNENQPLATRMDALSVLGALWFHYRGQVDGFEEAEGRMKSFGDLLHGMGSGVVATFLAVIVSLRISAGASRLHVDQDTVWNTLAFWFWAGVIVLIVGFSYLTIRKLTKDYFIRTVVAALHHSRQATGVKYVSPYRYPRSGLSLRVRDTGSVSSPAAQCVAVDTSQPARKDSEDGR